MKKLILYTAVFVSSLLASCDVCPAQKMSITNNSGKEFLTAEDSLEFKGMVNDIQFYEKVKATTTSTTLLMEAVTALKYLYAAATKESFRLAEIYRKEHE
jgi:hypothetical protein